MDITLRNILKASAACDPKERKVPHWTRGVLTTGQKLVDELQRAMLLEIGE